VLKTLQYTVEIISSSKRQQHIWKH